MVTASSEVVRRRYPRLARILDLLSTAPEVRSDLVNEIREQIRRGEYLTEEKLNVAICRLLKEILG
ncbi:MAG: flagellar biosynthesis anti-sigma factor FlgM [Planctomycetota bacterium]